MIYASPGPGPIFREIALRLHAEGSRAWAADPPAGWTPRLGPSADIRVSAIDARDARWTLDGQALPARDMAFFWKPVPGEHVIEVEAGSGRDQVRFSVR